MKFKNDGYLSTAEASDQDGDRVQFEVFDRGRTDESYALIIRVNNNPVGLRCKQARKLAKEILRRTNR